MLATRASILDTIVAQATPYGTGAVAIVRLSGSQARAILRKTAVAWSDAWAFRALHRVVLCDRDGFHIDDAMAVEMPGPRSYTGEDVVELHLHGAQSVVNRVLQVCVSYGARQAEAGEFTLRAFLHGRIDLSQAEAVSDMLRSETEQEQHIASSHLKGVLSRHLSVMCDRLEGVLASYRAVLDFPEYVLNEDDASGPEGEVLQQVAEGIQRLLEHQRTDLHKGLRVVLAGPPNAGKSTLLNAWVGYERALVDDQPGTTRDVIDTELHWKGRRCKILDTAGVRLEASGVEARGIGLTYAHAAEADKVIWLMPAGEGFVAPPDAFKKACIVFSKTDMCSVGQRETSISMAESAGYTVLGCVSSHTGEGIDALKDALFTGMHEGVFDASVSFTDPTVVRKRHVLLLEEASSYLACAVDAYKRKAPLDAVAEDVEKALMSLGRILGRHVDLEVLDRVFSEFCIGK